MTEKTHISKLVKPTIGDTVKDKLTGIEGIVVAKTLHIHGCEYLEIEPPAENGKISDTIYKPVERFELVKQGEYDVCEDVSDSHIKLGYEVEDMVTGYRGIAVMWNLPLFGAKRIAICPGLDKDGKMKDDYFFDEQRVKVITEKTIPEAAEMKPERKNNGCSAFKARNDQPRYTR